MIPENAAVYLDNHPQRILQRSLNYIEIDIHRHQTMEDRNYEAAMR